MRFGLVVKITPIKLFIREQKLRRSFQLYDENCSGKISKEEMVVTLHNLGKVKAEFD